MPPVRIDCRRRRESGGGHELEEPFTFGERLHRVVQVLIRIAPRPGDPAAELRQHAVEVERIDRAEHGRLRPTELEHEHAPTGLHHPRHLTQPGQRIRHVPDPERHGREVERRIAERQRQRVRREKLGRPRDHRTGSRTAHHPPLVVRPHQHRRTEVRRDHPSAGPLQSERQIPGPRTRIESQLPRLRPDEPHRPPPPIPIDPERQRQIGPVIPRRHLGQTSAESSRHPASSNHHKPRPNPIPGTPGQPATTPRIPGGGRAGRKERRPNQQPEREEREREREREEWPRPVSLLLPPAPAPQPPAARVPRAPHPAPRPAKTQSARPPASKVERAHPSLRAGASCSSSPPSGHSPSSDDNRSNDRAKRERYCRQ